MFTKNESLNIANAYVDDKFNKENDIKTGFKTNTIICVPILDQNDHPIGLLKKL